MNPQYLDFEQPIAELEDKIEELRQVGNDSDINITEEINKLRNKSTSLTENIFANLKAWDIARVARHPQRPYTLDYVREVFTDFDELHGDRNYADDPAIVGGLARLNGQSVMIIGHQKGREIRERCTAISACPGPRATVRRPG